MTSISQNEDKNHFNCPIDGCVYGPNGEKHFKKKMTLNHHIANVHSEKRFCCEKCNKKYAIEWQLKYHMKSCGNQWSCDSCDKSYTQRLSLITHCKRHCHRLPQNAVIRNSKTNSPQINVQLIVMPLILDSNSVTNQTFNLLNQKHINILPKLRSHETDVCTQSDSSTQTSLIQECNKCKPQLNATKPANNSLQLNPNKWESVSTQTDKCNQKSVKSRSTECQTITKRNRKPACNCESAQTQTLESTLHSNRRSNNTNCVKISASTSTSPSKKSRKRAIVAKDRNKRLCAFTQTVSQLCDTETSTVELDLLFNSVNPLLSQIDSTNNAISKQSVQTETDSTFSFEFNNIQTQTNNIDVNTDNLLGFGSDDDFYFDFTDIETQTNWNNDRTTQTDEQLDDIEIEDLFKKYLDNGNDCDVSDKTYFADTETQTQIDLPVLICSSAQT